MKRTHEYGPCISCGVQLSLIDDDPNGDHTAICARCRSEEDHDFDAFPGVEFARDGSMVERPRVTLESISKNIADLEAAVMDLKAKIRRLQGPKKIGPWEDHKI